MEMESDEEKPEEKPEEAIPKKSQKRVKEPVSGAMWDYSFIVINRDQFAKKSNVQKPTKTPAPGKRIVTKVREVFEGDISCMGW